MHVGNFESVSGHAWRVSGEMWTSLFLDNLEDVIYIAEGPVV